MTEEIQTKITYDPDNDLWYIDAKNLRGCHSSGSTLQEASTNFTETVRLHLELGNRPIIKE